MVKRGDARRFRLNPYQRDTQHRIGRGNDHWRMATGKRDATFEDFIVRALKKRKVQELIPLALKAATGPQVYARVSDNRWIADCECGGAEVVDPYCPLFYCISCCNNTNGGRTRPVEFPSNIDEVEDILTARDDPFTRGYTPIELIVARPDIQLTPEAADDLKRENIAHGLPETRGTSVGTNENK